MDIEDELKHWGIFGMKWGVRNYQNPDGSLTPAGRIRYGVGPARNTKGISDAGSLSDEELYKMTKRYQKEADYYQARNNYIYQENQFKRNTTPPKKEHAIPRFLKNVFGVPFENFMARNTQFGLGMLGYSVFGGSDSDLAIAYLNSVTGAHLQKKDNAKEELDKLKQELKKQQVINELNDERKKTSDYERKNNDEKMIEDTQHLRNLNNYESQINDLVKTRDAISDFLAQKIEEDPDNFDTAQYEDMLLELDRLSDITGNRAYVKGIPKPQITNPKKNKGKK